MAEKSRTVSDDNRNTAPNKSSNGLSRSASLVGNLTAPKPFSRVQITQAPPLQSAATEMFEAGLSLPISMDPGSATKSGKQNMDNPAVIIEKPEYQHVMGAVPFKRSDNAKSSDQQKTKMADRDRLRSVQQMPNPNAALIKKTSFLHVSVEFLMEELGYQPPQMVNNSSIDNLKAQYVRNKKRQE